MRKQILILFIFILLTIIFTFPLILRINAFCPGFSSTDELLAPVWNYWYWQYSLKHGIDFWATDFIAHPFGMRIYGDFFPYVYITFIAVLSTIFNYIAVYNTQILLNFILTGFFTYLLAYKLTKSRMSGLLTGIIFTFAPQHFVRSWQHITLSYFQWMPLYIIALFKLKENLSLKQAFLVGLTLFAVASFDLHYLFFMFIATLLFICSVIIYSKIELIKFTKHLFIGGMVSLLLIMTQFYRYILKIFSHHSEISSAQNIFSRPFEDLFAQSARPLSYFLPSTEHPIFGMIAKNFVGTNIYGMSFTEHALYLGWIPLILAFVAFRIWRRSRSSQVTDKENFYIGFFVFLAIAAWLFSQPPWWDIFGFKIYMPSFFMYKILPMFRAYCRFGIVVMLSVAVLAGFGLKFILERFKSQRTKVAVTALFCGLVLFEFWNWPPYKVIDLSKVPAVYYWIKEQPKDIVIADYPLDADSPNELYKFFQTVHEKKIINGTIPGTHANKVAQEIRRLSQPKTASILKWMGVKYVVVHKDDYLKTDLIEDKEDMERISQNQGLKFVKSFPPQDCPDPELMCVQKTGPVDVYEVVAELREPEVKN